MHNKTLFLFWASPHFVWKQKSTKKEIEFLGGEEQLTKFNCCNC